MPIHGYEGFDGSGKSYLLAQDVQRWKRHREYKEVWSVTNIKDTYRLRHPHQAIFLRNSIIVIDEVQRYYPATNKKIDPLTKLIISTHRHRGNVILWASQAWEFVHSYIRYETRDVWQCFAINPDRLTGRSRWLGTNIQKHEAELISSVDRERDRAHPKIQDSRKFYITKKGCALYNSFEDVDYEIPEDVDDDYIANLRDPHLDYPLIFKP
jgi:hypothetical protein